MTKSTGRRDTFNMKMRKYKRKSKMLKTRSEMAFQVVSNKMMHPSIMKKRLFMVSRIRMKIIKSVLVATKVPADDLTKSLNQWKIPNFRQEIENVDRDMTFQLQDI